MQRRNAGATGAGGGGAGGGGGGANAGAAYDAAPAPGEIGLIPNNVNFNILPIQPIPPFVNHALNNLNLLPINPNPLLNPHLPPLAFAFNLPPPPLPGPNNNPFNIDEIPANMIWVLAFLGAVINMVDLMHRIAVTLGDPNCLRFMQVAQAIPEEALTAADRVSFMGNVHTVAARWTTGGVVQQAPQQPIVVNVAAPAERVSGDVVAARAQWSTSRGNFDPPTLAEHDAIFTQGNTTVHSQLHRDFVTRRCQFMCELLTKAQINEIITGGFFSSEGVTPVNMNLLEQQMNSRLPPQPMMSKMEALVAATEMLRIFVNAPLSVLLTSFYAKAHLAIRLHFPQCGVSLISYLLYFLHTSIFPLLRRPSSALNPILPLADAACTTALVRVELLTSLLSLPRDEKHNGALPGPPRAIGGGGGGGGGAPVPAAPVPAPAVPLPAGQYRQPPPGKTRPQFCNTPPGPCPRPANNAELCYASHSTFGRCPYASCTKQHDWTGITAAEQTAINAWLALWLRKRKWDMYTKWSDNGGNHATWPALCN